MSINDSDVLYNITLCVLFILGMIVGEVITTLVRHLLGLT